MIILKTISAKYGNFITAVRGIVVRMAAASPRGIIAVIIFPIPI
jgi:hypothetical protein